MANVKESTEQDIEMVGRYLLESGKEIKVNGFNITREMLNNQHRIRRILFQTLKHFPEFEDIQKRSLKE